MAHGPPVGKYSQRLWRSVMNKIHRGLIMTVKNIKYKVFDLVAERDAIKELVTELNSECKELDIKIKSICHHPEEYVEERNYYFDGSYLDQAYTEIWNECTLCGTKSEIETENHSWYG